MTPASYNILKYLLNTEKEEKDYTYFENVEYLEYIMETAYDLMEKKYHLEENKTFITGIKKLMHFMNTDLSVFYRRIIDAYYYVVDYWNRFYNVDCKELAGSKTYDSLENCDRLSKKDYEKKLSEICNVLQFELLSPKRLDESMLPYFHKIQDTYSKYIVHKSEDMSERISRRVGKTISVIYFWE